MIKRSERHKAKYQKDHKIIIIILVILGVILAIYFGFIKKYPNTKTQDDSSSDVSSSISSSIKADDNSSKIEDNTNIDTYSEEPQYDEDNQIYYYKTNYVNSSTSSTMSERFWVGFENDHVRPNSPITSINAEKYNMYYIGHNSNVIYLTFNEDNENTQAIRTLSILKMHNIKATFFLSKEFIEANKETVKLISDDGHFCCNLSSSKIDMIKLAKEDPKQFIKEVVDTEDLFFDITGRNMTKLYRFSDENYSKAALDYVDGLGYKTLFWSLGYKDWNKEDSSTEEIKNIYKNYYHPGGIFLIHDVNTYNPDALNTFIDDMTSDSNENKYSFDVPSYLISDNQNR